MFRPSLNACRRFNRREDGGSCRAAPALIGRATHGRRRHGRRTLWLAAFRLVLVSAGLATVLAGAGCVQQMADQPRYEPLEASPFFDDGRASRPLVEGTVPRGQLRADVPFFTGKRGGKPIEQFPRRLLKDTEPDRLLARGRERYDIFCSVCHGRVGTGDGMVVRAGFPQPPSYHIERLRNAPPGHFFDVITNGIGRMRDYAAEVPPQDRWAIVAYIRALQLSQHADVSELSEADRKQLEQLSE